VLSDRKLKLAIVVFACSLVIRVGWVGFARVTPISDFQGYDELAVRWQETGRFARLGSLALRTPGYPGFLAAVYAVGGHNWKAAALVQAVLGALSSGLLFLLAAQMLSLRASLIAAALYTLSPTAVAYVPVLATETVSVFLLLTGLLWLAGGEKRTGWRRYGAFAGSGVVLGLLVLVRPAAVFFLPACFLLGLYYPRRRLWRPASGLVLVAAAGLTVAPWLVRNQLAGVGPTLSTVGGENLWMGNNDLARLGGFCEAAVWKQEMLEAAKDRAYRKAARAWILSHPGRYLELSGIRAFRLLGVEPDTWAAKYLVPTPANDLAISASFRQTWLGEKGASPELIARAGEIEVRNANVLKWVRFVVAPLVVVGLVVAGSCWREYGLVLLPALFYLGGLSFTYAEIRFRELMDPLLLVPLAGLLSALVFGTAELAAGPAPPNRLVAGVVGISRAVSAPWRRRRQRAGARVPRAAASQSWAASQQEAAGLEFTRVDFASERLEAAGAWRHPTWSVKVSRAEEGGIQCEVQGGAEARERHQGGVSFPVSGSPERAAEGGLRALRLEASFLKPEHIEAVGVEALDSSGGRGLGWRWEVEPQELPPKEREVYVLIPGKQSWYFLPAGEAEPGAVVEVLFFVEVAPASKAGFVLHRVEVGR
jgi:4-amino-4-deoxy-L-arabinose transferase-like glycosyltransferase